MCRRCAQLTGDTAALRKLLDGLAPAVQARIDLDNGIASARRLRGEDSAIDALRSERAGQVSGNLDDRVAELERSQRRLLESHLAAERRLGRITIMVIILGCALALAAVG